MTEAQVNSCPEITSFMRGVRGGKSLALKAMRFSDGELTRLFLDKYDSMPERDRQMVPLEAIALSAGVDTCHLMGEILLALREYSNNSVKFMAFARHPEVMRETIDVALTPGGVKDREHVHTMLKALPSSKGTTFIDKLFVGTQPEDTEEEDKPTETFVDDVEFTFPDCEVMQERVQGMRQKLLEGK